MSPASARIRQPCLPLRTCSRPSSPTSVLDRQQQRDSRPSSPGVGLTGPPTVSVSLLDTKDPQCYHCYQGGVLLRRSSPRPGSPPLPAAGTDDAVVAGAVTAPMATAADPPPLPLTASVPFRTGATTAVDTLRPTLSAKATLEALLYGPVARERMAAYQPLHVFRSPSRESSAVTQRVATKQVTPAGVVRPVLPVLLRRSPIDPVHPVGWDPDPPALPRRNKPEPVNNSPIKPPPPPLSDRPDDSC